MERGDVRHGPLVFYTYILPSIDLERLRSNAQLTQFFAERSIQPKEVRARVHFRFRFSYVASLLPHGCSQGPTPSQKSLNADVMIEVDGAKRWA